MKIGYIGLGKMGQGMVKRLLENGHEVIATDPLAAAREEIAAAGAQIAENAIALVKAIDAPRTIWVMVPHKYVDDVLDEIAPLLSEGDTVIDGGNSPYKESVRRGAALEEKELRFMDIGVSGGPSGARNGACMMAGGKRDVYAEYESLLKDLCVPEGYGYMGKTGSGHFVKMVHNGIEYGMMQAIGEGFAIMKEKKEFEIDLTKVAGVYSHGSVITSSLVSWLENAYKEEGENLDAISGEVSHSGEGLWTVEAAKELGVDAEIIEKSLAFRESSQGNPSYTGQVVSALRNQFGGHDVAKSKD